MKSLLSAIAAAAVLVACASNPSTPEAQATATCRAKTDAPTGSRLVRKDDCPATAGQ